VGLSRAQEPAPDPQSPPAPTLPATLTLASAVEIFRARGYDLLVAQASVDQAEGTLTAQGAIPNPGVNLSVGKSFLCGGNSACDAIAFGVGVSDNNALSNLIIGKTELKKSVAGAALEAAKLSRADALRTLTFQVKNAYFQVLLAEAQLQNTRETRESNEKTQALTKRRVELGDLSDADLATIDVAALEAAQAEDQAVQAVRVSKVALAFLLGFRERIPDYAVEAKELDYAVPPALTGATREALIDAALQQRPDLRSQTKQQESAQRSVELAYRQRWPDFGLGLNYNSEGTGTNAITPPTLTLGLTFNLPVFYLQQGEIRIAEASLHSQSALQRKAQAQVVSDVETAWAQVAATRVLVERMQSGLLGRAKTARDLVQVQYEKGKASMLDFLNAQRTYTATRTEFAGDLANYWTAVAQLEQATAKEMPR
jgi:cobalt-zinc-cadmium efflux system outer membrane protein